MAECLSQADYDFYGLPSLTITALAATTGRYYEDFEIDSKRASCGDAVARARLRVHAAKPDSEDGERIAAIAALVYLEEKSLLDLMNAPGDLQLPTTFKLKFLDYLTATDDSRYTTAPLTSAELRQNLVWALEDTDDSVRALALRLVARKNVNAQIDQIPLLLACAEQADNDCSNLIDEQTLPSSAFLRMWPAASKAQRRWLMAWAEPSVQTIDFLAREYLSADAAAKPQLQSELQALGEVGYLTLLRREMQHIIAHPGALPVGQVDIEADLIEQIAHIPEMVVLTEYFSRVIEPAPEDRNLLIKLLALEHPWLRIMAAIRLYQMGDQALALPQLLANVDAQGVLGLGLLHKLGKV